MKRLPIIIVVLVILVAGGILLANKYKTPAPASTNNTPNPTTTQPSSSTSTGSTVTIQNFAFAPADITVKAGTSVTWTNQDGANHTVVETDGQSGPQSPSLAHGQSYSFTFASAGTYKYHCSIHPSMIGTITVTQ